LDTIISQTTKRMKDEKVKFLPFHAINEFMVPEYQRSVLQKVLGSLDKLPDEQRKTINSMFKHYVKVPGFRNTALAPLMIKVKGTIPVFEKEPEFTAQVLQGWSILHIELRQMVFDLLTSRGWELLPVDTDRTKMPGFMITWPKDENFEIINKAFVEKYPDQKETSTDDISLMTVWLSLRLPLETEGEEEDKTADSPTNPED